MPQLHLKDQPKVLEGRHRQHPKALTPTRQCTQFKTADLFLLNELIIKQERILQISSHIKD